MNSGLWMLKMNKEQMREEYEAWLCADFDLDPSDLRNGRDIDDLGEEKYSLLTAEGEPNPETGLLASLGWFAWQASREALVVELPGPCEGRTTYLVEDARDGGWNDCLEDCREAIEAKGIKVK